MIKSNIVKKNFSRDPDYYHCYAETQHYVADKLASISRQQIGSQVNKVLEIGCGTGFLTEKLLTLFPQAEFTITDISKPMLRFCENQTRHIRAEKQIVAHFIENDISNCCPEGKFELIISSLAFQWVGNLEKIILQLQEKLTANGILLFSTLSRGTFASVMKVFDDLNVRFPGPGLLSSQEITSACKCFAKVDVSNETRVEEFDSMQMFLHHIRGTGAGNASGESLRPFELKKILEHQKKISAEYNITYTICT